jgi:uncharacterized YigZ family protein
MTRYFVPSGKTQAEIAISRSRFIATLDFADSVYQCKALISDVRAQMPDASHHVYAYRVGYGNTVIEGMSDDGEPTGTAGPPILAIIRGAEIGDLIIVVTRYFGGKKLGKGGLVRAYGDAARTVLAAATVVEKIEKCRLSAVIPYNLYDSIQRSLPTHDAVVVAEEFREVIVLSVEIPVANSHQFITAMSDLSAGQVLFVEEEED